MVSGTFTEKVESEFAYITHTMYPHQKYTNVFVSDIYMKRKTNIPGGGVINIEYPATLESEDIDFGVPEFRYANRLSNDSPYRQCICDICDI